MSLDLSFMVLRLLRIVIVLVACAVLFGCSFGKKQADVSYENENLKEVEDSIDKVDSLEIEESMDEIDERGYLVKVGNTAPDFEIKLIDGNRIRLTDLRGKSCYASIYRQLVWGLPKRNASYRIRNMAKIPE